MGQDTKIDLTGTWAFTIMSEAGTGTPTVTFKQDGEKLTGHYSSMLVGEADLKGTVKGQTLEFIVSADFGGMPIDFKFTGTMENKDSLKGKLETPGLGNGTFTANARNLKQRSHRIESSFEGNAWAARYHARRSSPPPSPPSS